MKFSKYILLSCACLYFVRLSDSLAALANDGADTAKLEEKDKELQSQIDAQKTEIESLKTRLDESATEKSDVTSITAEIETLKKRISELSAPAENTKITELVDKVSALETKFTELSTQAEKQKEQIAAIANNPQGKSQLSGLAQAGAGLISQAVGAAAQKIENIQPGLVNSVQNLAAEALGQNTNNPELITFHGVNPGLKDNSVISHIYFQAKQGIKTTINNEIVQGAITPTDQEVSDTIFNKVQQGASLEDINKNLELIAATDIQAQNPQAITDPNQQVVVANPEVVQAQQPVAATDIQAQNPQVITDPNQQVVVANPEVVQAQQPVAAADIQAQNPQAIVDPNQQVVVANPELIQEVVVANPDVIQAQQPVAATDIQAQNPQAIVDPNQQVVVANPGNVVTVKEEASGKTFELKEHSLLVAKPVEYIDGVKVTPISVEASDILKK